MKKVLLDFGTNFFQGLEEVHGILGIDDTWEIHTYEANPMLFEETAELHKQIEEKLGVTINRHNKGVLDKNDIIKMHVPAGGGASGHTAGGHFTEIRSEYAQGRKELRRCTLAVEAVAEDIADIITPHIGKEIYIKMDIETSEYRVIDRILEQDLAKHIKQLFVEYHPKLMSNKKLYEQKQSAQVSKLEKTTKVVLWH